MAEFIALKETSSWKRASFIEAGGWAAMSGVDQPIVGAAALCAKHLMDTVPAVAIDTDG